jgi:cytochrome c-type biogenesis protein CcmH
MIVFIVLAVVLAAICVALITVPLIKPMSQADSAPWTALAAAGVLVIGSAALYSTWSNWSWRKSPGVASPEGMVERLVHRLNDHPDDLDGWLLLGRSYAQLEEYPLAVRAFDRADRVAGGHSAEALVGEANALVEIDDSELTGQAGQLIERALVIDPSSPPALFFGAAAALRRGDLPLARTRFTRLLGLNPPAEIRLMVQREIDGIDRRRSGGSSDSAAAQTGAGQHPRR